ncbi:MAG: hypothetical protein EBT07_14615 [Actinobacteria bacterium]|nr:hypothetical protein [Actinomycetota bacterium]
MWIAVIIKDITLASVSSLANLTPQKVVAGLVFLAGVLAAPVLTNQFLAGDYLPVIAVVFGIGSIFYLTYLGKQCWVLMPAFLGLNGRLNFLPANLSMIETAILISLLFLLYQTVFEKNLSISFGPAWIWVPASLFLSIIAYHWVRSGDIGIRLFGGENFGGRKNWSIFIGFVAMPILYSMVKPGDPLLRKVPLLYFIMVAADFLPFLISSFAPSIAPYIYRFYSSVNLDAFQDTLYGSFGGVDLVRVGNVGFFGAAAQITMLSYFPASLWLRPKNWWCFPASLFLLLATIFSGFRSYLFRYLVIWLVAGFSTSRWLVVVFVPIAAATLFILVEAQGTYIHLPLAMQRTLSPLPGKWDPVALDSATGSSNWRETMKRVYWSEYADKAGWFGLGMTFEKNLAIESMDDFYRRRQRMAFENELADARGFIERRQPHEGLLDVHYPTGWVGTGLLIFFFATTSFYVLRNIYTTRGSEMTPEGIWVCSLTLIETLSYFTVYGDLSTALPRLFILIPLAVRSFEVNSPHVVPPQVRSPLLASPART